MPRLGLLCCRPGLLPKPTSSQDLDTRSPSQLSQDPAEGWPQGRSDNASKITPVEGHVPSTLPACLPETGPAHREASVDWMVCVEVVLPASGPPWGWKHSLCEASLLECLWSCGGFSRPLCPLSFHRICLRTIYPTSGHLDASSSRKPSWHTSLLHPSRLHAFSQPMLTLHRTFQYLPVCEFLFSSKGPDSLQYSKLHHDIEHIRNA